MNFHDVIGNKEYFCLSLTLAPNWFWYEWLPQEEIIRRRHLTNLFTNFTDKFEQELEEYVTIIMYIIFFRLIFENLYNNFYLFII